MKPSAIHPVVSINSIYGYFTADHISDCKQRIIEIITYYYVVSDTCHLLQIFDSRISTLLHRRHVTGEPKPFSRIPHKTHQFSSLCKKFIDNL